MADSIKIPIEIITRETLEEIKKFSREAQKSLSGLNKVNKEQNELLEKTNRNLNILTGNQKAVAGAAGLFVGALALQSKNTRKVIADVLGLNLNLLKSSKIFNVFLSGVKRTADVTGSLADAAIVLDKGLVGLGLNLSTASIALLGLGKAFETVDNEIISTIGQFSIFVSLITGSLSLALIVLIKGISELSVRIGTDLVNAARAATKQFVEFEKKTFVFERTLTGFNKAFGDSIGTVESWAATVKEVSDATGFTEKALRGAVTEIVATTSALGFNEEQQKKLLEVTTDYASFLGDDVVQTTIEFISALNGQAQSIQKYGVKLGATNIQQKLYSKGIDKTFQSLGETEKVQIRFNSLLDQYRPIAGNASAVTSTLAGQQKVLENNVLRLGQSFGEGAALIENNNLVAAALNAILNNVGDSVLKLTGFLTSLGGRLLQVGGFILGASFNVLALIKGIKILNVFLRTQLADALINTPIPLFNRSLLDLVRTSGAAFISFNSLGDILKTFGSILVTQVKIIVAGLLGIEVGALSLSTVLKTIFVKSVTLAKNAVVGLGRILLKLAANPVVAAIIAAALAIAGLVKLLKFVNDRTGVLTELWSILNELFAATSIIFRPILDLFASFAKLVKTVISKAIGGLVVAFSKLLSFAVKLLEKNPFNIFSKDQVERIQGARERLDDLSSSIVDLDFNVLELKKTTSRAVAGVNKSFKEVDLAPLLSLKEELKDVGLTDLAILKKQRDERLKIIQEGLSSEGKAFRLAKNLEKKILEDFAIQEKEILDKQKKDRDDENRKRLEFLEDFKDKTIQISKEVSAVLATVGQSFTNALSFAFGGDKAKIELDIDQQLETLEERLNLELITETEFKLEKESLDKQRQELEQNATIAIGTGFLNGLAQGAKGAEQVITGLIKSGLNLIVPGLGEALGPLIDAFAQGPEATRKMVDEFVKAIPILIENIILAIPAFIEAIADNVDIIIMALVDRLDDIIIALVRAMPRVATKFAVALAIQVPLALIKSFPKMALDLAKELAIKIPSEIIKGIVKAFKGIGGSLFKDLGKLIFQGFIAALTGGFNILGSLFKKIFGFDGGGRGPVEKFLGFDFPFIKFSSGGLVGGSAKTRGDSPLNDTIPALLSAGEIVVPRSAVSGGAGGVIDFLMGMGIMPKGFFLGGLIEDFVSTLAGGLGSLIGGGVGFVSNLFDPFGGLIEQAENYLTRFTEYTLNPKKWIDILKSLARIGAEIDLDDLFDNPLDVISNAVKGVLDFFQGSFKNLLKANSPFAQGGMVPAGFNNDTFNARLTSGEYVIDRGLTGRLNDYLAAQTPQAGSNNMSVEILSKILSTMQKGHTINTNVEFNGDSLANIILELNRSNARLA